MQYQLRPYQVKAIEMLRGEISKGVKRPLLFLATGGGKGLIMSEIANGVLVNGKRIIVVMRRSNLIHQTKKNFLKYHGIKSSIIMSNVKEFYPNNPCQICSIDTIRARMDKDEYGFLKSFDVCLVDEGHDINSPTYQNFITWIGDKIIIPGMTATPFAMGGKPLKTWQTCIKPIEMDDLRDQGFLAPAKVFCPSVIDVTGIRKINGDFNAKELFEKVIEKKIVGDIIETYKKYGNNMPAILFAVNKDHSMLMAHAFNQEGIPAIHQEDSHTQNERQEAINNLVSGKIKILCNVNIFSTGTDIPEAVVGIMARPTMSETLYVQQVGRLLRPHQSKESAIILDHAGNTFRHGLPYDKREADLEAQFNSKRKKQSSGTSSTPVKTCPECFCVCHSSFPSCPSCNFTFKIKNIEPETRDGELEEISELSANVKLIARFNKLKTVESIRGWKPNAKFFMLYEEFGDAIYNYTDSPKWIGDLWRKSCPECKSSSNKTSEFNFYKCEKCDLIYSAINNIKEIINGKDARNSPGF